MVCVCLYYGWRLCYQLDSYCICGYKTQTGSSLWSSCPTTVRLCSLCICCDFVDMYSDGMHVYIYICAINTFTLVLYLNTVEIIFTSFSANWQRHRLLISISKDLIHNHDNVFYNL